jgi:hypothetical protein
MKLAAGTGDKSLVTELSPFAYVVSLTSHHLGQPTSTVAEGNLIDGRDDALLAVVFPSSSLWCI